MVIRPVNNWLYFECLRSHKLNLRMHDLAKRCRKCICLKQLGILTLCVMTVVAFECHITLAYNVLTTYTFIIHINKYKYTKRLFVNTAPALIHYLFQFAAACDTPILSTDLDCDVPRDGVWRYAKPGTKLGDAIFMNIPRAEIHRSKNNLFAKHKELSEYHMLLFQRQQGTYPWKAPVRQVKNLVSYVVVSKAAGDIPWKAPVR